MTKPRRLDWDSEFFNFDVFDVRIDSRDDLLQIEQLHVKSGLYYIRVAPEIFELADVQLASRGQLVDEKLTFRLEADPPANSPHWDEPSGIRITSVLGKKSSADLIELAIQSGQYSRFAVDQRIPHEKFRQLYSMWMERSLSGDYADEVFACQENDKILGICTVKLAEDSAIIGLLSVAPEMRGKNLGTVLLNKTREYAREHKKACVLVATQASNVRACNFYMKNGYFVASRSYIYHVWT